MEDNTVNIALPYKRTIWDRLGFGLKTVGLPPKAEHYSVTKVRLVFTFWDRLKVLVFGRATVLVVVATKEPAEIIFSGAQISFPVPTDKTDRAPNNG